jgi:hypothetical protein
VHLFLGGSHSAGSSSLFVWFSDVVTACRVGAHSVLSHDEVMHSPAMLVGAVVLVLVAVVLTVIAVRRNGWRGTPASLRERLLIYVPIGLCVFVAGILLIGP